MGGSSDGDPHGQGLPDPEHGTDRRGRDVAENAAYVDGRDRDARDAAQLLGDPDPDGRSDRLGEQRRELGLGEPEETAQDQACDSLEKSSSSPIKKTFPMRSPWALHVRVKPAFEKRQ